MAFRICKKFVENPEYFKTHYWLRKNYGKALICSNNKLHQAKRYDWANISGKYLKDISDWKQLCRSCHIKLDGTAQITSHRMKKNQYRKTAILQLSADYTKFIKGFNSIREAAIELKIGRRSINNVLSGWSKTAGRYGFVYGLL